MGAFEPGFASSSGESEGPVLSLTEASSGSVAAARDLALRQLVGRNAPFDRWRYCNDSEALSAEAIRGFALFAGKAGCASCHLVGERYALFTDYGFHNTGTGVLRRRGGDGPVSIALAPDLIINLARDVVRNVAEPDRTDDGRLEVTGRPEDLHRFKTPSLRNVALTAPYMHNVMFATLRDVIDYYNEPDKHVSGALHRDAKLDKPLALTPEETRDLEAFLNALTDDRFVGR